MRLLGFKHGKSSVGRKKKNPRFSPINSWCQRWFHFGDCVTECHSIMQSLAEKQCDWAAFSPFSDTSSAVAGCSLRSEWLCLVSINQFISYPGHFALWFEIQHNASVCMLSFNSLNEMTEDTIWSMRMFILPSTSGTVLSLFGWQLPHAPKGLLF